MRNLYQKGDRRQAAAAVNDDLIDAIAICGPVAHCRAKLAEWRVHGVGNALMNMPVGVPPEVGEHLLHAMAPA